MNDRVLNLPGIRDYLAPHTPLLVPRLTALLDSATQAKVSRRTLLKMLGTALPVPAVLSASGQIFHSFQISNEHGRIAFIVGGIERWVIDPNSFAGDPQTRLMRRKGRIEVQLLNAIFPGTGISASFASQLRKVADGWMMDFKAEFGEFETSVDFLKWLQGLASAKNAVKLSSVASVAKDAFRVEFNGSAVAEFHPRWQWLFSGQQVGRFRGFGETLLSDRVVLALPPKDESSLLRDKPSKRTVIGFDRGAHVWNFKPPVASSQTDDNDEWVLRDLDDLFDRLTIETAAEEGRETTMAVLADAPERVTSTTFAPSNELFSEDDHPFEVALQSPRLAAVQTDTGLESAFMADYAPTTVRAFGPGYSMSLRTTSEARPFEVVSLNDKVENLEFNPEVLDVHAPVQGAITEPCVPLPDDGDVDLPATEHSSRKWWKVWFWPPNWGNGAKCLKMGMLPPVKVVRPEDLLVLEFSFTNIVLEKGEHGIPRLIVAKDSATPGIVQINFPPQSITEQAFFQISQEFPMKPGGVCMPPRSEGIRDCDPDADKTGDERPTEPPVAARMAGSSQLMFALKPGEYLDYTIEGLLDWSKLTPRLVPGADGPKDELKKPYIINPLSTQPDVPGFTALEMPYRLYLSPNSRGAWKHRKNPIATDENRVELWHTRLGTRVKADNPELAEEVDEKSGQDRTVRAIWSFDYTAYPDPTQPCTEKPQPFRMSLSGCDRHELVRLTSDYELDKIDPCPETDPKKIKRVLPVQVNQLMLSSLGSFMNVRGAWEPLNGTLRVEEWINRTTMARDHYVKVVYKGYLFPLGHRASLIKVTERKFEYVPNATDPTKGDYVAYLRQRMFIVVRERIKHYPALGQPFAGRRFPFQRVEFAERDSVTPDLDLPVPINGDQSFYNFWPSVHHACYNFRFTGWDEQGPKHLTAPLIFVDNIIAHRPDPLRLIFQEYEKVEGIAVACEVPPTLTPTPSPSATPSPTPSPTPLPSAATCPGATRYINICGDPIAYGPSRKSGDTSFPTEDIKLAADKPDVDDALKEAFKCADQPPFYPAVELAAVHVPSVEEFTGKTEVRDIRFPKAYLEHGFDLSANAAEIFAEILTKPDPNPQRNVNREPLYLNFGGPTGGNGDRSGGLSTPNQRVVGLSRRIGLVGGSVKGNGAGGSAHHASAMLVPPLPTENEALEKALRGEFDPFDFFGGALSEAKLLGVVKLADIIKVVLKEAIGNLGDAPKLVRNTIYRAGAALDAVLGPMVTAIEGIVSHLASADIPAQLKQRLQPSLQELRNASAELSKAQAAIQGAASDEKKLEEARLAAIAAVGHAVQAGKQLVDECKRLANDPLAALGLSPNVLNDLKNRFTTVLNEVRGLIKDALLEAIRAEVQRALDAFKTALDASGFDEEKKRYIEQIEQEISSVKDRIESALADLRKELEDASDILTANLGPVISLAAQFLKDAYELRDRYEQLKDALHGNVSNVGPAINSLLKLKVVEDAVGADRLAKLRSLETTFQTSRKEFEDVWKPIRDEIQSRISGAGIAAVNGNIFPELRDKGESLYARAQAALRSIHDLPDSAARKAELDKYGNDFTKIRTIVDDYTEQFSHGLLGAQREFVDILIQLDRFAEELRAQGIKSSDLDTLKTLLETIGKQYTVIGKYFDQLADPAVLVQRVADLLPGKLKDDVVKKRDELVQLVSGRFLEDGLKAIDKLDEIRQRATYDFLMAGSAMVQQATPFINAYNALNGQVNEYQTQVRTAAGTLRTALLNFESDVPNLLRPAVSSLLTELITKLGTFSTNGSIQELPSLMQTFLRLRDQIVGVFTNPVDQLQKLIDVQKLIEGFVKEFGIPTQIALSFDWKPPVKTPSWPIFQTLDGCEFLIRADALIDLKKPAPPAFNITGRLTNFQLNLLPSPQFVILIFDKVEFKSQNGGPLAVDVKIQGIQFGQSLEFVKRLAEILNPKSGPFLDIQPTGITAGFRFGWPMIPVGGMVMYGLNLFAGITLPFTGEPMRLRLGVSDRARPFLLAVGVYAGGGFLTLDMDASGIQKVQGALEFGAHVELNFFEVAKGHGSVMAGFFFSSERKYKQSGEAYTGTTLCGYVRASGELSIIGLISVSLDILVQVCYVNDPSPRVYGRATVKVEISILFFSATVEVTAEYTFLGGSGSSSHHAVADTQKQALPAGSPAPTHDPILSTAFRWEEFQRAFHD